VKKKLIHKKNVAKKHVMHTVKKHAIVKKHVVLHVKKHFAKRFCPNCGKHFTGSGILCKDCTVPDFKFKDIKIVICNSCHSFVHKNKWTKFKDINLAVKKIATDNITAKVRVGKIVGAVKEKIMNHKAGIKTEIILDIIHKTQHFDIPAKLAVTLCPKCSKKGTTYFESIIQLRNCNDEIIDFVRSEVAKHNKKGIFINKEVPLDKYSKKDVDVYITNQTYAKTLAARVKKNYGGIIKKNAQHFSLNWQTTRTIYRLNVLIQLPNYFKNDVLKIDNHLYKIISVSDNIHVEDLRTKHKTSLAHKESYDVLKPVLFQVIKRYPEFEVLDPATYYQARLMNPSSTLEINQKIKVIIDGGEAWMV
jgi:NMD protein affecting ribosome stability and mRNA decay